MTIAAKGLPEPLLVRLSSADEPWAHQSYCAGFEVEQWRCSAFADHIIEWIADYALREDELDVNHGNMYVRMKQAAVRVYSTEKYSKRGEFGEIVLHAICRSFFDTIPLAPRVFFKTSSNDVVKSFDMAHVRYLQKDQFEIWLGESKFYKSGMDAVASAVESIRGHINAGFLRHEKLILGPQIDRSLPHADAIRKLLSSNTSLDALFNNAVFPVCIACDSSAIATHKVQTADYIAAVLKELLGYRGKIDESGLPTQIRMVLVYVPLESKDALAAAFDKRLKGLVVKD
jgi:hypothetical protein